MKSAAFMRDACPAFILLLAVEKEAGKSCAAPAFQEARAARKPKKMPPFLKGGIFFLGLNFWRRDPESNRAERICNPVHNRFAIAP